MIYFTFAKYLQYHHFCFLFILFYFCCYFDFLSSLMLNIVLDVSDSKIIKIPLQIQKVQFNQKVIDLKYNLFLVALREMMGKYISMYLYMRDYWGGRCIISIYPSIIIISIQPIYLFKKEFEAGANKREGKLAIQMILTFIRCIKI